ncbi:MAG: uL22 family ribosomal protein [Candidatus Aenigmarchaeota archaeon]|nr:uL22 family ribosomal protein [Candidatus Aenigmarchaeota archaeon]MDW8149753.1 uL22 family ribosomal protein [Candidatus Aenigmarchaeota archaeon]
MGKTSIAKIYNAHVSLKKSIEICDLIRYKKVEDAEKLLERMNSKTSKKILELLKNAKENARRLNLNLSKLYIKSAKADKGEKFIRPRSRARFRGRKMKSTHLEIILCEKNAG